MILCKTMQSTQKNAQKKSRNMPQISSLGVLASPIFKCFEIKLTLTSIQPCRRTMQRHHFDPFEVGWGCLGPCTLPIAY
jgi:hypothetical protein